MEGGFGQDGGEDTRTCNKGGKKKGREGAREQGGSGAGGLLTPGAPALPRTRRNSWPRGSAGYAAKPRRRRRFDGSLAKRRRFLRRDLLASYLSEAAVGGGAQCSGRKEWRENLLRACPWQWFYTRAPRALLARSCSGTRCPKRPCGISKVRDIDGYFAIFLNAGPNRSAAFFVIFLNRLTIQDRFYLFLRHTQRRFRMLLLTQ